MSRGKKTTFVPEQTSRESLLKSALPEVTVIKTASCLSRSGRSELRYQLGKDDEARLYIKIAGNSGNGHFNVEWLNIEDLHLKLATYQIPFGAQLIKTLFEGKSVNTLHFVFAALLSEEFLIKDDQNSRRYRLGDVEGFMSRNQDLPIAIRNKPKSKTTPQEKSNAAVTNHLSTSHSESDDESLLDILLQSA